MISADILLILLGILIPWLASQPLNQFEQSIGLIGEEFIMNFSLGFINTFLYGGILLMSKSCCYSSPACLKPYLLSNYTPQKKTGQTNLFLILKGKMLLSIILTAVMKAKPGNIASRTMANIKRLRPSWKVKRLDPKFLQLTANFTEL